MSFICSVCGEEHSEDERSHGNICIYCDTTVLDDTLKEDGQLF